MHLKNLILTSFLLSAFCASGHAESGRTPDQLISDAVARRLRADAQAVLRLSTNAAVSPTLQAKIAGEMKHIEQEIPSLPTNHPADFRAVLPLNPLHGEIFAAQAAIWRASGANGVVPWDAKTWDPLPLIGLVPAGRKAGVNVAMMNNAFRAGAFNLSNAGAQDETVRLKITGLPGGENPSWITVQEVAWTDTKSGQPVAAALPEAQADGGGFLIHLSSGLTRQVWFTFHPTNVPAGLYHGRVVISGQTFEMPLNIKIYPVRLLGKLALHMGGWDYTDRAGSREITEANRPLVIAHLQEHFVDSPWATPLALAAGKFGPDDRFVSPPDVSTFDQWQSRWPGAARYCVFLNVDDSFAGTKMGTPQFEKRVGNWIQFWARHLKTRGVKPEQLFLLLSDEPWEARKDAIISAWSKAIHAAHAGVKVWEDPIHNDPSTADQEMLANCDVLCPNRVKFLQKQKYQDYFTEHRPAGPELAFYSCSGPMPSLDPYTYVRLQAWSAWQYGAQSSYFWAFSDCGGGASWNEYTAPGADYVPFFIDKKSVTPGKHMEAFRESAEDYECLVMLRDAVAAARRAGRNNPAVGRARKLLAEAAERVCGAPGALALGWATPKDRSVADSVRIEVLDALSRLQNADN